MLDWSYFLLLVPVAVIVVLASVGALQNEDFDLADPGPTLDLRPGGKARRRGSAAAATVSARSRGPGPPHRDPGSGIDVGRPRPYARIFNWIACLIIFCLPGAMILALPGGRRQRFVGWAIGALAVPCAFLAARSTDAYLVVRPGGLERVNGWGSRGFMPWGGVHSVSLGARTHPRTTRVLEWVLTVRGVASGRETRFKTRVDVPGIGDLAAAILLNVPASTLAQEPDAADAIAAIAAVTGRPISAPDPRRRQS